MPCAVFTPEPTSCSIDRTYSRNIEMRIVVRYLRPFLADGQGMEAQRFGDHCVEVGRQVIFLATGK